MNTNVPTVGILNQETRSTTEPLAGMTPTRTPRVLQNSFRHATAYSPPMLRQRCNGNGVEYGVSRGMLKTISCEPNIVVVMSRFVRGLFQTARTISTIDPTAGYGHRGEAPPAPCLLYVQHWNICSDQFPWYFFVNVSACRVV